MAFLLPSPRSAVVHDLCGHDVVLRAPTQGDYEAWADLRAASKTELTPYEPKWASDELSRVAYRHRLKHYAREAAQDLGYAFLIFRADDERLAGSITLSNVRRGVADAASVGYWIGTPMAGQGLMTSALRLLAPFAFQALKLHRLDAGCVAENTASIRVLEKSGFHPEGVARGFLRINGTWRDHLLFARLASDTMPEVIV